MLRFVAGNTRILPSQKERFWDYRRLGYSIALASKEAGFSLTTGKALSRGKSSHNPAKDRVERAQAARAIAQFPLSEDELCDEARHALKDFELWRIRYTGHVSTPWQVETAHLIVELLGTGEREYVVENCPPGAGKSTLLVDIAGWVTCRNRAIRGLFISRAQSLAVRNAMRLRRMLERTSVVRARAEDVERGLAVDGLATLAGDYGRFNPGSEEVWRRDEYVVVQADGGPIEEKEPTWSAFGFDAEWIGNRFDLMLGDDMNSSRSMGSVVTVERNRETFDSELEPRLEPGGLLWITQQRLGLADFSRHCLDKKVVGDDGDGEAQYRHVVFKAHYPDRCEGVHGRADAKPYPDGCLLDPHRISWRDVQKAAVNGNRFAVVYQQEDVDPADVLVPQVWVNGGVDASGVECPGCWDKDRGACELPAGLAGPLVSVVTADPSPTRMWSVQWWVWQPSTDTSWLMDMCRRAMEAPDFLECDPVSGSYSGLLDEWFDRSVDLGLPFRRLVVEKNAAQRFMLQYTFFKRWAAARSIEVVPHETLRNKLDSQFGVQASLKPMWQHGRVRLPSRTGGDRMMCLPLVTEVTTYPGPTDDCVMAQWFHEYDKQRLAGRLAPRSSSTLWRPSWMKAG